MPMRRAVLITRQAISPRFAIRIRLNMLFIGTFGRVPPPAIWHAGVGVTIASYSKMRWRQRSRSSKPVLLQRERHSNVTRPSPGIAVKPSAHIGARDRLHQFADFGFQIIVGDDQGANGGSRVAAAGCNGLVDRLLQSLIVFRLADIGGHVGNPVSGGYVLFLFSQVNPTLLRSLHS